MKKISTMLFASLLLCVTTTAQELFPYSSKSGTFGYKNVKGKVIIKPQWNKAEPFSYGIAKVNVNKKVFFINLNGEELSEEFDVIRNFELGYAITISGKKYGLIDLKGKTVFVAKYSEQEMNAKISMLIKRKRIELCKTLKKKEKLSDLAIADSLYSDRNYSKAITYYEDYVATPRANFDTFSKMANCYNMLGSSEVAAVYFSKALEFKEDPITLYKLAGLYYMHQKYSKSLEIYERALVIHPNNAGMLYSMAKTCSKLGYYDRSYELTLKASTIDPLNFAHFFNLSYYSLFTNHPEMAIKAAKRSLELDPKQTGAYTNLVLGYVLNDEFRNAKVIYKTWKGKYFFEVEPIGKVAFLQDIEQLEKMRINHKDFKKAKKILNK